MILPIVFLISIQSGVSITPEDLIDASYAERGYGGTSRSALPTPAFVSRADDTPLTREIRMKNRWRMHPHKTMPGLLIAEVPPHADLFEADGFALRDSRFGGAKIDWPPKIKRREDLSAPGGVLVRVNDLLSLYKIPVEEFPWIYRYRVLRVRIDPKRVKDPRPLVRALTGAKMVKDKASGRETTEFDPVTFRPLAVAALKRAEGEATDELARSGFYLGRYGHERITDAEMKALYRVPNALIAYQMPSFEKEHPGFITKRVRNIFGDDPQQRDFVRFREIVAPDAAVAVGLMTEGKGILALRNREDDAWFML